MAGRARWRWLAATFPLLLVLGNLPPIAAAAKATSPAIRVLAAQGQPPARPAAKIHRAAPQIRLRNAKPTTSSRVGLTTPTGSSSVGSGWNFLGPQPIQNLDTYGNVSGRVTALAVDPTSTAVVYAGTAGGGVWKTTNSGTSWVPLTDGQPTLAIGGLAIDPSNHLTIYASTGEPNRCGDCQLSQGILKSLDGGLTWTLYGQSTFAVGLTQVGAVAVDRTNSSHVFAATNAGLYQSSDGGHSWSVSASLRGLSTASSVAVDDLFQDPDVSTRFWATVVEGCTGSGLIAVSNDSGSTWVSSVRMSSFTGFPNIARIGLGEGPGGVLYAAAVACADATHGDGQLVAVIKSTNAGSTWPTVTKPGATLPDYFSLPAGAGFQGTYDNVVAVDHSDATHAVFGGVTMLATKDGGSTFVDIARPYSAGPVHPDFHAVGFAGAGAFYAGNDGGVWKTANLGGTGTGNDWTNLNATLAATTFNSGTALDSNHMIGGAQDDGTSGLIPGGPPPPAWNPLLFGDGGWTAIDPTQGSTVIYGETPFGDIWKGDSTNPAAWQRAGPCFMATDPACSEPAAFVAPFVMDPANPARLYAGTTRVYRTTTGGLPAGSAGWTPISPDLTSGTTILATGDFISAMAIDSPDTIVTGSYGGRIFITTNAGAATPNWTEIDGGGPPGFNLNQYTGNPWVTSVAVHAGEVWVTLGILGTGRVWERIIVPSLQYPWIDVTGTGTGALPNVIVHSVSRDPGSGGYSSTLYLGTDSGAFICGFCGYYNVSPSWSGLGAQLPGAQIDTINLSNNHGLIVAWTHGRGAWSTAHISTLGASPSSINFGNQTTLENSQLQPLQIFETGVTTATNLVLSLSGANPADFLLNSYPASCAGVSIVPGGGCGTSIVFHPSAAGPRSATLTVTGAAGESVTIQLTGNGVAPVMTLSSATLAFGNVGVWTGSPQQTVTISNTGTVNLDITNWTVSGPDAGEFDGRGGACSAPATVRAGTSCSFQAAFYPKSAGSKTAYINITDNAGDSPQIITMTGTGVVPNVSVSPTSLSFPDQVVHSNSTAQQVQLGNNGPGNFIVFCCYPTNPSLSGANPGDFLATSGCGNAIAPATSCSVDVYFEPKALGTRTATLSIADNAGGSPHTVLLSGNAIASPAGLSPSSLDFANQAVGTASTAQSVTLTNNGSAALVVSHVDLVDPSAAFSVLTDGCTGASLGAGASCMVTLDFGPKAVGTLTASLQIYDSAPDAVQRVPLSGTGITPVQLQPGALDLGKGSVGTPSTSMAVTLKNIGSASVSINSIATSGDFSETNNCPAAVTPAASCTISITFTATATGIRNGTLTVTDSAVGSPQSIALMGMGISATVAVSTQQYQLANSDGTTWKDIDGANLSLTITPAVNSTALLGGNADLWTTQPGYNQDLGLFVAEADATQYPGHIVAWKESGGFAGTFSPNAAFVQTAFPMTGGTTYHVKLQWKANKNAGATIIVAGAGPWPSGTSNYSPTTLTARLIPVSPITVQTAVSTQQYQLTNSDGTTWQDLDATNLALTITPTANSLAIVSGNADLWTTMPGFNQDFGIYLQEANATQYPGNIVAWKESGGFAGTFSPNAAFVQTVLPLTANTTYHLKLRWKTNRTTSTNGEVIVAGAGPWPAGSSAFSPTRLTVQLVPAGTNPATAVSTQQYLSTNSDGTTWQDLDATNLALTVTPATSCLAVVSGNADLWTTLPGYNQDLGIYIEEANANANLYPSNIVAWKESGGFAGTFSPNAAFVQAVFPMSGGVTYHLKLRWKTNKNTNSTGETIVAGAGPWPSNSTQFSPTRLTVQLLSCS